jgi:serine protease Do
MKRHTSLYALIVILIIVGIGIYAFKANTGGIKTKDASILPNFHSTTHIKSAKDTPVSTLADLNKALENIAKQVNPTVVTINVTETVHLKRQQNPFSFFGFFNSPFQNQAPLVEHRRALGSGVIVSKDGYILTNNHVIANAHKHIRVTLNNHKVYKAKVVGADPYTDIAVIKIDAHNLPAINMGNSDSLKVGSLVMAIGSPESLSHTVTFGIVSAKHRHIHLLHVGKYSGFGNYIQTDAAINPGNSGGAMVNMSGELVGINAAIYSKSGMNGGIGFAVPINLARRMMKQIIKTGKVVHAELGIQGGNINSAMAQSFGLKNMQGIIINSVQDNSPASRAGLKKGDVIKTVNGKPVGQYLTFRTDIATSKPGRKLTLGIIRNGKHKTVHVKLGKLQVQSSQSSQNSSSKNIRNELGFQVQKLTANIKRQLNLKSSQKGVIVNSVKRFSSAWRNGLVKGDVITHINKQKIENMDDFNKEINKLGKQNNPNILLQVINRQGMNQYIAFTL